MAKVKQLILTIHGVKLTPRSDEWQETARTVLEPHFEYHAVKYGGYSGVAGLVRVLISPLFLFWLVTSLSVAILFLSKGLGFSGFLAIMFTVMILAIGLYKGYRGRWVLSEHVKGLFENVLPGHQQRPHIIAHSLGTYLTGTIVRRFPSIRASRVVLVGSVLPSGYCWQQLLRDKPHAFEEVRNEQGERDWFVAVTRVIRCVARDLGDSGISGFIGNTNFVHHGAGPWACNQCETSDTIARVHNVPLREFAHSDQLLSSRHAEKLWLPFFWGFSPKEYDEYLTLCEGAAYYYQEKLWLELAEVESQLYDREWSWLSSRASLDDYLAAAIRLHLRRMNMNPSYLVSEQQVRSVVDDVVSLVPGVVVAAIQESGKRVKRNAHMTRALHPLIAVARAIERAVESRL